MSFRRPEDEGPGTSRWRLKHRDFLARCGLPDAVLDSDRALRYVLLHGDDELGTGWDSTWLRRGQARDLLAFLEREIADPAGYELIPELRRYLGAHSGGIPIRELQGEGAVAVGSHAVRGHVRRERCPACRQTTVFDYDFDAAFCPSCDAWLEGRCGDSGCEYCTRRPEKPSSRQAPEEEGWGKRR